MGKNQFKNLEKHVVLKCESCGGFHTEEESEVIFIKVIKGKNCTLDQAKLFSNLISPQQTVTTTKQQVQEAPAVVMTDEAARLEARRQRSIIPPNLRGAFSKPPGVE